MMDFRKRYKVSLYILIPFIVAGLTLLVFLSAFHLGKSLRNLESPHVLMFLFVTVGLSGLFGFLVTWIVLNPIEKFLKEAGKAASPEKPLPARSVFSEKDEIDRFEEAISDAKNVLPVDESRMLFPEIVAKSGAIRAVLKKCTLVAPTDTTVLITGESGTGKELLATAIHRLSGRKERSLIAVNCVAIPEGLLESELFGHEKGAFTGAVSKKKGKFETAHGGTIFLDEIGDMPLSIQAKILRVLQEKEIERVGGNEPFPVDVRVIAATNQNLSGKVKAGTFREDLYHRIKVFDIELPPLRRRREDILPLARHFLREGENAMDREISPVMERTLLAYEWPGNVRELKNLMERALILAAGVSIGPEHLPDEMKRLESRNGTDDKEPGAGLDEKLADIEKGLILDALKKTNGIQARAAEVLGISQRSLWHRVKKYGIDVSAFK